MAWLLSSNGGMYIKDLSDRINLTELVSLARCGPHSLLPDKLNVLPEAEGK